MANARNYLWDKRVFLNSKSCAEILKNVFFITETEENKKSVCERK